jgi:hypothetical protein
MTLTPERLAAYADGELEAAEARDVELELARSPELQAQLDTHRALKAALAAHYAPIAEQPVPQRLVDAVRAHGDTSAVVDLAQARSARQQRAALPRWTWLAAPALAASLAWLVVGPVPRPSGYAGTQLAAALDRQLVATQPAAAPVQVLLSFRNATGNYCRGYTQATGGGIACRDSTGWRIEKQLAPSRRGASEYRQAGSSQALMEAVQEMAVGPALDAPGEEAARARRWTSR